MVNANPRLSAALVEQAHEAIRPHLPPTRLAPMKGAGGRRVFLKLETDQPTGSFKVRGALSNLLRQPESRAGFVTASAGNHGLGVAWAAKRSQRRERVTIFIPTSAPQAKVAKFRQYEIDLRIGGDTFDDAERLAREFERETGARYIHAYDDPLTAAGQGTLAIEIQQALAGEVGTLVVPVGGGGLISGVTLALRDLRPDVVVIGAEPLGADDAARSKAAGERLPMDAPSPIADGLRTSLGELTWPVVRDLVSRIVTVSEDEIAGAMRLVYERLKVVIEPSAGVPAAVALRAAELVPRGAEVAVVLCGGNVDLSAAPWSQR